MTQAATEITLSVAEPSVTGPGRNVTWPWPFGARGH